MELPFEVPLVDQETGEVRDRLLVGRLALLERDSDGRLVVVDTRGGEHALVLVEVAQFSVHSA